MRDLQHLNDHERIRRELWSAVYQEAQKQSAVRVKPEFCWAEDADRALQQFDRRFGTPGVIAPDGGQQK